MARKDSRRDKTVTRKQPDSGPPADPAWLERMESRGFWVALAALAILLLMFFNPIFFGGKTYQPPDQVASLAHRPYIDESFEGTGGILDRYPLWTPYIFSGMPTLGSLIAAPYTNPMSLLLTPIPGIFKVVTYYFLLGIFTWLFLRRRGLNVLTALFGTLAFVFSAHVVTLIMFGHNSKIATLVFLPLVLMATDALWERPSLRWISLLGLAIGTMLVTSHFQIAYYTLLAAGLYLVVSTVASLRGKEPGVAGIVGRWAAWGVGAVIGFAANAVLFLPVREYAKHSIRGGTDGGLPYDYATNWSFHPLEMATFFVPSFMGFGGETYWGWMPFTDFPHYMGILVLFLAIITVALWPREKLHLYFATLGGLALVVAFGKHLPLLYNLLFEFFPYFNKFRVPSMILFLLQFSVAALAALGLGRILTAPASERPRILKVFWITAAVMGGLIVVLGGWVASGAADGMLQERLAARAPVYGAQPQQMLRFVPMVSDNAASDTVVVLAIFAAGLGLLWLALRNKAAGWVVLLGLLLLTTIDLWRVDARPSKGTLQPRTSNPEVFRPSSAVQFLQAQEQPYRVLPMTGAGLNNNLYAYFKIPSILGYNPAKLKIYQDLIDDQGPVGISKSLSQGNFNIVNMLNLKYVIADQELAVGPLRTVHRGGPFVMENTEVLPRMWFVDRTRTVADPTTHLAAVADPTWRPAVEALTFEDLGSLDPGTGGTATLTHYEPRELDAEVNSPGNSLLVLSEVYYGPGWKAWLDDQPVDIHRVNYVLRGVVVPPGQHTLRMRFDPSSFANGAMFSLGAYVVILVGLAGSFVLDRRRRAVAGSGTA